MSTTQEAQELDAERLAMRDPLPQSRTQITRSSLEYIGRTMEEAALFAAAIAKSGAAGPGVSSHEVFARIMLGLELGLTPMVAIREIFIVKGRPGISSRMQHTLLRRGGGKLRIVESTDKKAVVNLWAPGELEQEPQRFEWTLEMAAAARLLQKDTWQGYPMQLLLNRAISMAINFGAPEVLGGGMYEITELQDIDDAPALPAKERREQTRNKMRKLDDVFSKDPFKKEEGKEPTPAQRVVETLTDEDPPAQGDDDKPADELKAAEPDAKKPKPRRAEPKPVVLEKGTQAMAAAISKAAFEKNRQLIGGQVEITAELGGPIGLEAGNYPVVWLADQVNALEILRALQDSEKVTD